MKTRTIVILLATVSVLVLLWAAGGAIASPPRDEPGGEKVSVAGTVASKFSYQGRVTGAGGNPLDGVYAMQFRLYDAETEGTMLWDSGAQDMTVDDGLFSVELAADHSVFNGQAVWLEVTVAGEALPRQEILPVPYALSLVSGTAIRGTGPDAVLTVTNPDGPAIVAMGGETAAGRSRGGSGPDPTRALANDGLYAGWALSPGFGVPAPSFVPGEHSVEIDRFGIRTYYNGGLTSRIHRDGDAFFKGSLKAADGKIWTDYKGEIYARSLHIEDAQGNVITSFDENGSTHEKLETFKGGLRFTDASGVTTLGDATFRSVTVPDGSGGRFEASYAGLDFVDSLGVSYASWASVTGNFFTPGSLTALGPKTAVVSTDSYGRRKLYADESAEVYFFDRGQGQLVNGQVTIELDPVFLETVTIDDGHPMLVQVTLAADCNGVFVADQTATSFTVKELMGGTSNATFDWEVAAKRKGYEDERLEPFAPETP